jgi:pimeloyl-ACP methyl ester carboxylesterase
MNRGRYALASVVIAVALVEALAIVLALSVPEKRAFWLIAGLAMPLLWTAAELLRRDKEALRFSVAGAAVMIAMSLGVFAARAAGLIDAANGDLALRLAGVASGLIIVGFGNVIPKRLVRFDPADPARKLALQRFTGWVIVLAGLANALVWALAPMDRAALWSMAPLLGALGLVIVRCTRWRAPRGAGLLAIAVFLFLFAPSAHAQEPWTGDWHGTIATPTGGLRLVLTIRAGAGGALSAELESIDQAPGQKIPVVPIAIANGRLTFSIPAIGATYDGAWQGAENRFHGIFHQGADVPLDFERGAGAANPVVAGLDGRWQGSINRNGVDLRLIVRISTGIHGTIASLDSPDQMAMGVPIAELGRDHRIVTFTVPVTSSHYRGTLSDDGNRIDGIWTRAGYPDAPVNFVRALASAATQPRIRPQTPHPPFPYRSEEVHFANPRGAGVTLAGTLTLPDGHGPFAAAILITGSGPQDRDETLLGHKPFAVLADFLTRHGIAVLRYDDRGVGGSTGPYAGATSADFATDANAAFAYLRARREIAPAAIGFVGHSEGGMIGPLAAMDNQQVGFLVLMAGPGTDIPSLMEAQRRAIGQSMGVSSAELDRTAPIEAALFSISASDRSDADARAAARAALTDEVLTAVGIPVAQRDAMIDRVMDPWFRYFAHYDPAPALRRIRVPVLAINGSLDRQVVPAANLAAIRAALAQDRDVTITELPGLNHLFQTAHSGGVGEYADIEETMAPTALATIADWINHRFPGR